MKKISVLLIGLILFSCGKNSLNETEALESFSEKDIEKHVKILASDDFMGRNPFTEGETKTINYLKDEFTKLGLNSFFQEVPLIQVTGEPSDKLIIKKGNTNLTLALNNDFVIFSRVQKEIVGIDGSELVFAGYGIVAPEYNWNDYKDIDVKGKTVVVLVNDPGIITGNKDFFKGNTMTYYGRWTYKYEEAARQGAKDCIIIHDDKGAGYNFSVVRNGATFSKLYLQSENGYKERCEIEGWITTEAAKKLVSFCGFDSKIIEKAATLDHKSTSLGATATTFIKQSFVSKTSNNVFGYLEGTDKKDELIVISAHWDCFGIGPKVNGDSIYNGAIDNGTSLAWMLETAEAFTKLKKKQSRSILFFAPTAEEAGLLGSSYYTENPIYPLAKTIAVINNDLMFPYGKTKDVMVTGYGQSDLDDLLEIEAKKQDRYLLPDPNSHTGMFFRSDHFSFAKEGVPALFARSYHDHYEKGKEWMRAKEKEYLSDKYHKTTDEFEEDWDLSGVVLDSQLLFNLTYNLSNSNTYPKWKESSEFKNVKR
ncbi:M28 family peptidase [Lutibacter sp.]|uniref:M28 family peptidase n=1 Tax=Lutibacter sp. TaxID=1925666 RepID=UPI0027374CDD|nr:M28 family peptidase [Lutibacter sp.]MDP3313789.1 M28 family peptidase [Lutibacter sp.]